MNAQDYKERIGQLCYPFKLPTVGSEALTHFTNAGHGNALESLVDVLEMESEDQAKADNPSQARLKAASWQDLGYLRSEQAAHQAQAATR